MKRKFKTKRDVHIRSGAPRRGEDNAVGFFQAGRVLTLEVESVDDEECEMIAGNNTWYRIGGDLYVWDGDLEFVGEEEIPKISSQINIAENSKLSLALHSFEIPKMWELSRGKGVRIALLDSGVDASHEQLQGAITEEEKHSSFGDLVDRFGHGTQMAGIIAGRNVSDLIIGLAPDAEILSFKMLRHDGTLNNSDRLVAGIEYGISRQVDIISISYADPADFPDVKSAVKRALRQGIVIIAAAGDNTRRVFSPAKFQGVFSIGALDITNGGRDLWRFSPKVDDRLDFVAPGTQVLTSSVNRSYKKITGTSPATAFMSGLVALIIAWYRKRARNGISRKEIYSIIQECSDSMDIQGYGNGYINTDKLIDKINSS